MHPYYTKRTQSTCRKDKTLHLNSENVSTHGNAEGKAFHNAEKLRTYMRWIYNMAGKEVVGGSF